MVPFFQSRLQVEAPGIRDGVLCFPQEGWSGPQKQGLRRKETYHEPGLL